MPTVRAARREDIAQLVAIYNHYVENTNAVFEARSTSLEERLEWFGKFSTSGPHRLLVALEDDRVVGCASSSPYRAHPAFAETVEFGIYVGPELKRRGIGSALYSRLIRELSSEAVHVAVAGIALPNPASVALHRKFNFTEVGVFVEYALKNGTYISSVWMQRRLGKASSGGEPSRA